MIEVTELNNDEIEEFVKRLDYGHLACCSGGEPYVVPIHYAYEGGYIYVYTTQGKKSEIISKNPRVCLQIEDVKDNRDWTSVVVFGEAQELKDETEKAEAVESIVSKNPTMTPAVSIHWMDNWVRENIEVIYRITPLESSGRRAIPKSETHASFANAKKPGNSVL
jgi:nitroimidazol reductase NimA-like FMN-containing flavoprotein (pyridoxamine 5'-phosphate oxidase superfamily)